LLKQLLKDLQVNPQRMRANILATQGLVHAEAVMLVLAKTLGKQSAHRLVYDLTMQAQSEGLHLKQALINNPQIGAILGHDEIEALFNPEQSTGVCAAMVEQVIARISLP
jgi:adenylosuccinate lyase